MVRSGQVDRVRVQQLESCAGQWNPLAGIHWSALRSAYRVFLTDPAQGILHILRAGRHSQWQKWVEQRLARQAGALAYQPLPVDLAALIQLPPDTLGGAYSRHMVSLGFDPETFMADNCDQTPLRQRIAICHDVYHILTGFGATPVGEFGVAAFTLVQYRDLLNVFVLSFVPFSLTNPCWTRSLLQAVGRGWHMGVSSRPVISYPIENHWSTPLAQVRQDLGLATFFSTVS